MELFPAFRLYLATRWQRFRQQLNIDESQKFNP